MKDDLERKVPCFGISRRDFLKYCGGVTAILSLPGAGLGRMLTGEEVAEKLEAAAAKPPVIWLEGQDCAGCSISFLNSETPPIADIILDTLSIRYHESVMAASGHVSDEALVKAVKAGGYVLVVEGSIPSADDRFYMVGGKPFRRMVEECAEGAAAIIAVGACAAFGGIPRSTPSAGKPVSHYVKNKPIINLPMCPAHHEHIVETVVYFLTKGSAPELDKLGRPKMFFGKTVHDQCERKEHFDRDEYLSDWNDPKTKNWCLAEKGCKGPDTYSDCPTRLWNSKTSYCIACGAPCQGCAEPSFYGENTPLYEASNANRFKVLEGGKA